MRWVYPEENHRRVITYFLFCPTTTWNKVFNTKITRWLEFAEVDERFINGKWTTRNWVDI